MLEQPLNLNENILNEAQRSEGEKSGESLELVKAEEMGRVVENLGDIRENLIHDQAVTERSLFELEKELGKVVVNIGGFDMLLSGLRETFKQNKHLWKMIEEDSKQLTLSDIGGLTYLTLEVAEWVVKGWFGHGAILELDKIIALSPDVARCFGNDLNVNILSLMGLTALSEEAAIGLAKFKGDELSLPFIQKLDFGAAKALSEFRGKDLKLTAFGCHREEIPDNVVEALSFCQCGHVQLSIPIFIRANRFREARGEKPFSR